MVSPFRLVLGCQEHEADVVVVAKMVPAANLDFEFSECRVTLGLWTLTLVHQVLLFRLFARIEIAAQRRTHR